jgi:hypothetical protein
MKRNQFRTGLSLASTDPNTRPTPLRLTGRVAASFNAPLEVITCVGAPDFLLASHLESGSERFTAQLQETGVRLAEEAVERAFGEPRPSDLGVTVKFGPLRKSPLTRAATPSYSSSVGLAAAVS